MRPEERDAAYLWDIVDAAEAATQFLQGKRYEDFVSDKMLRAATERVPTIVGEAARRVSSSFKDAHPEIPWRAIIGARNILVHEYDEVTLDKVWLIAGNALPSLVEQIKPLLPPIEGP